MTPRNTCPACEAGELRPGPLAVRCSGCGYALSRELFVALRAIRALPETSAGEADRTRGDLEPGGGLAGRGR